METETENPQEEKSLANSFEIPDEVQRRFEADEFRAEVERLLRDLRESIAEIGKPAFWDLAGLFTEFAVGLCLLAARSNPPASFRHPDRHVAFLKVWLPTWVKDEALKEWNASAPPGLNELLSNPKNRRKFRNKLDDAIGKALNRERQSNPQARDTARLAETPSAQPQAAPVEIGPAHAVPRARNWEDIELCFVGDHDVEIGIAGKVRKVGYRDMPGFEDRRNGKPSQLWVMLRAFAVLPDGTMPNAHTSKAWVATQKKIERTSKALRTYFALTGDPFPYNTGTGYHSRIKFKPAPDNPR